MPQVPEHTLEHAKSHYLMQFVTKRLKDVTDLAEGGNVDAVSLMAFALEVLLCGAQADEAGIVDYWQNLRAVETALATAGQPV